MSANLTAGTRRCVRFGGQEGRNGSFQWLKPVEVRKDVTSLFEVASVPLRLPVATTNRLIPVSLLLPPPSLFLHLFSLLAQLYISRCTYRRPMAAVSRTDTAMASCSPCVVLPCEIIRL